MHTIATQVKGNLHALAALAARERNRRAKHQASNSKLQRNSKSQTPNDGQVGFGVWCLVLLWSLVLVHPPQCIPLCSSSTPTPFRRTRPVASEGLLRRTGNLRLFVQVIGFSKTEMRTWWSSPARDR